MGGLRNLTYYGQASITDQVEQNVIWYVRDELIKLGAYYNIVSGMVDYNNNRIDKLRPIYQPGLNNFQFWGGPSHHWVWETGITPYSNLVESPIEVSGVYINNAFYATGTTGTYEFYVDYNRGGIVFTNALVSGTNIWCERSERAAFVYQTEGDEYRSFLHNYFNRGELNPPGSGLDIFRNRNIAVLPAVFIGSIKGESKPYELGNNVNFGKFNINFDVFSNDLNNLNILRNVCTAIEGHRIELFNVTQASTGNYPLDYKGRVHEGTKTRSQLISLFPYDDPGLFLNNAIEKRMPTKLDFHRTRISLDFELII